MHLSDYLNQSALTAVALARRLRVPPALLSQWRTRKRKVPAERCPDIEELTGGSVRCEDLRPDVRWGVLRKVAEQKEQSSE